MSQSKTHSEQLHRDNYFVKPGQDIVMTGFIALKGTARLALDRAETLRKTLPEDLIEKAADFLRYLEGVPEAAVAIRHGGTAMQTVGEGGILTALWSMAKDYGTGFRIWLRRIPVKQETIEICEVFDLNPYGLLSGGCQIWTADNGSDLVLSLEEAGIHAAVIGKITDNKDKAIINGDIVSCLNRPQPDELYRVIPLDTACSEQ